MTGLTNESGFFTAMREGKLLGPTLDQNEVDGLKAILEACGEAKWPLTHTAYALATAYHETAHTLQPIAEMGGTKYFTRMYDVTGARPELARKNGNTAPGDGPRYRGRGYVQLTWKNNYLRAEKECGIKGLVASPDLAMIQANAASIMVHGMEHGWFTGKSCTSYLPPNDATLAQYKSARRIINGTDKAEVIAAYAEEFEKALKLGKWA